MGELSRKVTILRVNEKTLSRRFTLLHEAEAALRKVGGTGSITSFPGALGVRLLISLIPSALGVRLLINLIPRWSGSEVFDEPHSQCSGSEAFD